MFTPETLLPGKTVGNVKDDFRQAERIEQYRLGEEAVYIPAGLRWNYIPRREILSATPSRRTVSAGHCVTVEVRTPLLELETSAGRFDLNLQKESSLKAFLTALGPKA